MIKDNKLLHDYMHNFYGYGNLEGKFWFIGMEEGGGTTAEEINSRLDQWNLAGKPTLLDNYEFHKSITDNTGKSFDFLFKGKKSKYQRTWGGLIKILLNYTSESDVTLNEVKEFQSNQLGRFDSNNCLMEVFPLPSPNAKDFNYTEWTNNTLTSRETYKLDIKDLRTKTLKNLIGKHKPSFVVFLSSDKEYEEYWTEVSGVDFNKVNSITIDAKGKKVTKAKIARNSDTVFAVIHHPVFPGVSNNYFKKVASEIRRAMSPNKED